jgi:hypothetical protein
MRGKGILLTLIILASCKTKPAKQAVHSNPGKVLQASYSHNKTIIPIKQQDTSDDNIADETAVYYVVVTDTGTNYYQLKEKMENIHQTLNISIDTMGRYYNKAKDLIALPDNDSDEIYAGDYYPRRYPTNFLSLEYMALYNRGSSIKTIALIAGIYENKNSADSALKILKPVRSNAFAIKSSIYMGCMH